ncbi:MAG: zinc metallopeptidase [Chitinophagales bacterium]|nr:zinc metallopeptidase [Chitinophagales bacterium]MDW8427763.1 zinc metallopeptidase [Chitinophagales bacterium]
MTLIWIALIALMVGGFIVQGILRSRMAKYSRYPTPGGLSGAEMAQRMLHDYGIYDVKITSVPGFLTDHYNPVNKTVNLSPEVYNGRSVMAAAIAAHECGHAVQHAQAYQWLTLRSQLVPVVSFSSRIVMWVLLAGILMLNVFPQLLLFGIILFALTTLFSFITLPVEFDASRRALAWISQRGVLAGREYDMAKDGLKWAAMTYVIAALASLTTLIYYILIYLGRRN